MSRDGLYACGGIQVYDYIIASEFCHPERSTSEPREQVRVEGSMRLGACPIVRVTSSVERRVGKLAPGLYRSRAQSAEEISWWW